MELKVTSERVLKAAESCAQAKAVLKELFPEAFVVVSKEVDAHTLTCINVVDSSVRWKLLTPGGKVLMCAYENPSIQGIWLNGSGFKFAIVSDYLLKVERR